MVLKYDRGRRIWILVSKNNPSKVLKKFGKMKPSREQILKEERRVQYFKHLGSKPGVTLVRGHHRKGTKGVRKHKRRIKKGGRITENQRKFFDEAARQRTEYGGELDFGKNRKLKRFTSFIGDAEGIDFPSKIWESEWHDHPPGSVATPSPWDVSGFINSRGNQAMIIFSKGKAVSITKLKNKRYRPKRLERKYVKIYNDLFDKGLSTKKVENEVIKELRKDGFIMKKHGKGAVDIPIKIIE